MALTYGYLDRAHYRRTNRRLRRGLFYLRETSAADRAADRRHCSLRLPLFRRQLGGLADRCRRFTGSAVFYTFLMWVKSSDFRARWFYLI